MPATPTIDNRSLKSGRSGGGGTTFPNSSRGGSAAGTVMVVLQPSAATIAAKRVEKRPEVCGGSACVRGRRIPVWGLVNMRRLGASDARILEAYPDLTPADLEAAWEYAASNPDEIDRDIRENEEGEEGFVE
jgi:uncharacterized protein (DUF433 family)